MLNKIIIFPEAIISENKIETLGDPEKSKLMRNILYWDKIVILDNPSLDSSHLTINT
ncbi:TPA: hypothetical protein ACYENZ_003627 [Klebsiella michiganensis]